MTVGWSSDHGYATPSRNPSLSSQHRDIFEVALLNQAVTLGGLLKFPGALPRAGIGPKHKQMTASAPIPTHATALNASFMGHSGLLDRIGLFISARPQSRDQLDPTLVSDCCILALLLTFRYAIGAIDARC
jgi:hypothetical protein